MKRYFIELEDPDLAYLVERTPEFDEYVHDMLWAQDYARTNREAMLSALVGAVGAMMGRDIAWGPAVNCHHNYTEQEHHHGRDLWVTRKGAIRARSEIWESSRVRWRPARTSSRDSATFPRTRRHRTAPGG